MNAQVPHQLLLLMALASLWLGCHPPAEEDIAAPVITIGAPLAEATFRIGDTIRIAATITENDQLHLVAVNIFDQATGLQAFESFIHIHTERLDLARNFVPPATDSTTYQLRLAALDHHGNESLEIRYFHVTGP